jgi:hypothetical protein
MKLVSYDSDEREVNTRSLDAERSRSIPKDRLYSLRVSESFLAPSGQIPA